MEVGWQPDGHQEERWVTLKSGTGEQSVHSTPGSPAKSPLLRTGSTIQTAPPLKRDGIYTIRTPRHAGHSWGWWHPGSLSELLASWNLSSSGLVEGVVMAACCSFHAGGQEAIFAINSEAVPLRIVQRSICGSGGHFNDSFLRAAEVSMAVCGYR